MFSKISASTLMIFNKNPISNRKVNSVSITAFIVKKWTVDYTSYNKMAVKKIWGQLSCGRPANIMVLSINFLIIMTNTSP